jgi:hypothetical protein
MSDHHSSPMSRSMFYHRPLIPSFQFQNRIIHNATTQNALTDSFLLDPTGFAPLDIDGTALLRIFGKGYNPGRRKHHIQITSANNQKMEYY